MLRAMNAGGLEFLAKPLNNDALVSEIGKALERSRLALALVATNGSD
jgi:FixJ family two-component response regulator